MKKKEEEEEVLRPLFRFIFIYVCVYVCVIKKKERRGEAGEKIYLNTNDDNV